MPADPTLEYTAAMAQRSRALAAIAAYRAELVAVAELLAGKAAGRVVRHADGTDGTTPADPATWPTAAAINRACQELRAAELTAMGLWPRVDPALKPGLPPPPSDPTA